MDQNKMTDIGLFILRLAVAVIFIVAGVGKLVGLGGTVDFFANTVGVPFPMVFAVVVMAIEIVAGLAVLVGVYTRTAALLLSVILVGAIILVKGEAGFNAARLDIALLGATLALAFIGPGGLKIAFAHKSDSTGSADYAAPQSDDSDSTLSQSAVEADRSQGIETDTRTTEGER